ncbi:MAG: hypothetical protein QM606_06635 [Leucobacter sp.]
MSSSTAIRRRIARRSYLVRTGLLVVPLLWLVVFFAIPLIYSLVLSVSVGSIATGFTTPPEVFTLDNYARVLNQNMANIRNSLTMGGLATVLAFLIATPLAYGISYYGGRRKTLLLTLVLLPFLTSYMIRIISWQRILGTDGPVVGLLRMLGMVDESFSIVGTPYAVVASLTYQSIPFVFLPIYISFGRQPASLKEAARDLYSGPWGRPGLLAGGIAAVVLFVLAYYAFGWNTAENKVGPLIGGAVFAIVLALLTARFVTATFALVLFPLIRNGLMGATLLSFIPAIGDYVSASILGNTKTQMIGNVIQQKYLVQGDFTGASALAALLILMLLILVAIYIKVVGSKGMFENVG